MDFSPVRSKRTFAEIAARIREMVISGQLKPGDKLPPERELSQRLNVGRNALREALRSLEMAGLVEMRRGKTGGAFITAGKPEFISDQMTDLLRLGGLSFENVTEARIWIGEVVVRAACERHTAADIAALEENVATVEKLFAEGRMMQKTEKNIEFHNILAKATKNPILVMVMRALTDMALYFAHNVGPDSASVTVRSRPLFMRALIARDVEAAVKEMETSLLRLQAVQLELVARQLAAEDEPASKKMAAKKPAARKTAAKKAPVKRKPAAKAIADQL